MASTTKTKTTHTNLRIVRSPSTRIRTPPQPYRDENYSCGKKPIWHEYDGLSGTMIRKRPEPEETRKKRRVMKDDEPVNFVELPSFVPPTVMPLFTDTFEIDTAASAVKSLEYRLSMMDNKMNRMLHLLEGMEGSAFTRETTLMKEVQTVHLLSPLKNKNQDIYDVEEQLAELGNFDVSDLSWMSELKF